MARDRLPDPPQAAPTAVQLTFEGIVDDDAFAAEPIDDAVFDVDLDHDVSDDETVSRWRRTKRAVVALALLGLVARLAYLGSRPFHHDEGLDAWFSWRYLNGTYDGYDPVYHGPLRFYATAAFFWLFGESDTVARLLAALTGAMVVAMPWKWRADLGQAGTIAAVGLIAISPSMLYFSRVGREDAPFLAITFATVIVLISLIREPKFWHPTALLVLLVAGMAVKESVFMTVFVFGGLGMVLLAQDLVAAPGARHRPRTDDLLVEVNPDDLSMAPEAAEIDDGRHELVYETPGRVRLVQRVTLIAGLVLMIVTFWWIGLDPKRDVDPVSGEELGMNPTFLKLGLYGLILGLFIVAGWYSAYRRGVQVRHVRLLHNLGRPGVVGWMFGIGLAVVAFVAFFTQFFTDWDGANQPPPPDGEEDTRSAPFNSLANGLLAGLRYWLGEQDTVRGDSRWQYYLAVIPAYEWFILALALIGIVAVVRRPTLVGQTLLWWGVASFATHSWAGERMPWLIIHPLLPFVLLAGVGCQVLWNLRERVPLAPKVVIGAAFGAGLIFTAVSSAQAAYFRGGEPEELFVQAGQATPEVPEWTERLYQLDRLTMSELGRHVTVSIDGDVYWPYGWYLRDFPTGTYATIDNDGTVPDSDLIFVPHWEQEYVGAQLVGYERLNYEHRWWWVPDFDVGPSSWLTWSWDRDPWDGSESDPSDCPGSVVGAVYVRAEIAELERRYYGELFPEVAEKPDYDGPCRRPEFEATGE